MGGDNNDPEEANVMIGPGIGLEETDSDDEQIPQLIDANAGSKMTKLPSMIMDTSEVIREKRRSMQNHQIAQQQQNLINNSQTKKKRHESSPSSLPLTPQSSLRSPTA